MKNNEQWKSPAQEALDGGKEIAVKFLENGQQMVKEYLDDPKNRKKILAAAVGIAKVAFKAVKK